MSNLKMLGTFGSKEYTVKVNIPIISFREGKNLIYYCPALDLSGYGYTEKEAQESFGITLNEFFKYTIRKGTFYNELRRLGWQISRNKTKAMIPPLIIDSLKHNPNFNEIFNNQPFKKLNAQIAMPATA